MKKKIIKLLKKTKKMVFALLLMGMANVHVVFAVNDALTSDEAEAANAESTPGLISGTFDLLIAVAGWILILVPIGVGVFVSYQAFLKSMSEDTAIISEKNKVMKNSLVAGAIAETAVGLASIVMGYYKG